MDIVTTVLFAAGSASGLCSGILLWRVSWRSLSLRWALRLIGLAVIYVGLVYAAAAAGLLTLTGYGAWLRPVTFFLLVAPAFIAWRSVH